MYELHIFGLSFPLGGVLVGGGQVFSKVRRLPKGCWFCKISEILRAGKFFDAFLDEFYWFKLALPFFRWWIIFFRRRFLDFAFCACPRWGAAGSISMWKGSTWGRIWKKGLQNPPIMRWTKINFYFEKKFSFNAQWGIVAWCGCAGPCPSHIDEVDASPRLKFLALPCREF